MANQQVRFFKSFDGVEIAYDVGNNPCRTRCKQVSRMIRLQASLLLLNPPADQCSENRNDR